MEPRFLNRGNRGGAGPDDCVQIPSMEPRFLNRGNLPGAALIWLGINLQWSHGFSTVETPGMRSRTKEFCLLQWSHGFSTVETIPGMNSAQAAYALQWSHGFSTVETGIDLVLSVPDVIGLQWSHGFSTVETPIRYLTRLVAKYSFNGATVSQPWKPPSWMRRHSASLILQWSHGFSSVETYQRLKAKRPWCAFNGATVSQPWKLPVDSIMQGFYIAFNGATVSQPWKPANPETGEIPVSPAFNGATVSQPWKPNTRHGYASADPDLQWSHGFSTVETFVTEILAEVENDPSMEPRFLNRGNSSCARWLQLFARTFNGATVSQPWKPKTRTRRRRRPSPFNGATVSQPWKPA